MKFSLAYKYIFLISCFGAASTYAQIYRGSEAEIVADKIFNRVAGIRPPLTQATDLKNKVESGNLLSVALSATEHPNFYLGTLAFHLIPLTNEAYTPFSPLNDAVATIMGFIRDELDFRNILSQDLMYTVNHPSITPYASNSNQHYEEAQEKLINLKDHLVASSQSTLTSVPAAQTAGILTSRQWISAYGTDGTNRLIYAKLVEHFSCSDLEKIKDITVPDIHVRRDVTRSPGGDPSKYQTYCKGCHAAHLDSFSNSFNYFDWDDTLNKGVWYGSVREKINLGVAFGAGDVPSNDAWSNTWSDSQLDSNPMGFNMALPQSGYGPKGVGVLYGNSQAFYSCMGKKSFKIGCAREPGTSDEGLVNTLKEYFISSGYNMKKTIAYAAVECVVLEHENAKN